MYARGYVSTAHRWCTQRVVFRGYNQSCLMVDYIFTKGWNDYSWTVFESCAIVERLFSQLTKHLLYERDVVKVLRKRLEQLEKKLALKHHARPISRGQASIRGRFPRTISTPVPVSPKAAKLRQMFNEMSHNYNRERLTNDLLRQQISQSPETPLDAWVFVGWECEGRVMCVLLLV